jgi:signal transduction histidine kinase
MSSSSGRPDREAPSWVPTALLAAGQAAGVALIVVVGTPDVPPQDYGVFLFAVGFGALLLLRAEFPAAVLVVAVLGVFMYYAADYPPIGMAVPVVGAFYAAAERGRLLVAAAAGAVLLSVSLFFRARDGESSVVLAYDLVTNVALVGCALALALVVRSRRSLRDQHRHILSLERERQRERVARQVAAERLRIARDVHDSLGHSLSVVSVQARVAQEALGRDHRAVARALEHVVAATRTSLADLRRTVAMLRAGRSGDGWVPPGLDGIDGIERTAQAARDAGLTVDLVMDLGPEVPADRPASTAFWIVQESVTNVLRHAHARRVEVIVRVEGDDLRVRVVDDGAGGDAQAAARGQGITGMRERAALVGGDVSITVPGTSGFAVDAVLPLRAGR